MRAEQDSKISENFLNDILNKAKNIFCQRALNLSIKVIKHEDYNNKK